MTKLYLLCFLIAHLLGDFYWQTPRLAAKKIGDYSATRKHCYLYSGTFLFVALIMLILWRDWRILLGAASLSAVHFAIDLLKCYLERSQLIEEKLTERHPQRDSGIIKTNMVKCRYVMDQLLHIGSLLLVVYLWQQWAPTTATASPRLTLFVKACAYSLVLMKPTNVTFKLLFDNYQPADLTQSEDSAGNVKTNKEQDTQGEVAKEVGQTETVKGAGALIGSLERLIMGIFIFLGQYASIAIILTAKTITRYNKIVTDPGFSEYYLIGTLYSILVPLVAYGLIVVL